MDLPDGTRKRRAVYAPTRKEVRDRLAEIMGDAAKGIVFDDEKTTVGEFVTRWLEDSAAGDLAPRTLANYWLQVRHHIVPGLGRVRLSKLSAAQIQHLYAVKLRDGLKPSSVRYIHAVLHRALEQAVRWNMIPRNPASLVDPPKIRQDEITPLDADQARAFLDATKCEKFEALFVLALTTGLRMGESLGLKWFDVDLDAGTLR